KGESVRHETLLWDEAKQECRVMRSKEESADYRYFPEPDLPLLALDDKWIEEIQKSLPELPDAKMKRFREQYGLSGYESSLLCAEKNISLFYENVVDGYSNYKNAANWVLGEVFREMKERNVEIDDLKISAEGFRELLVSIDNDEVSPSSAKIVFAGMTETGKSSREIIKAEGLTQVSNEAEIETMVRQVLRENPVQLEQYLDGKNKIYGYFVGQVMRLSGGKANPGIVNRILKKALNEIKDRNDE
ncbi:MAG: Asp-tRNA(Asn)/Glu-tRNA(Gln) amidotransferase GatCAB subunit B, partial [candidate division Zixibacteria bacterium]|nr:Asp-tRNA(Asn)/Glu-tRNA(Gln) amidotransferase GatCAB subunit B [candidate division Zixibacteria bacterium]